MVEAERIGSGDGAEELDVLGIGDVVFPNAVGIGDGTVSGGVVGLNDGIGRVAGVADGDEGEAGLAGRKIEDVIGSVRGYGKKQGEAKGGKELCA